MPTMQIGLIPLTLDPGFFFFSIKYYRLDYCIANANVPLVQHGVIQIGSDWCDGRRLHAVVNSFSLLAMISCTQLHGVIM